MQLLDTKNYTVQQIFFKVYSNLILTFILKAENKRLYLIKKNAKSYIQWIKYKVSGSRYYFLSDLKISIGVPGFMSGNIRGNMYDR